MDEQNRERIEKGREENRKQQAADLRAEAIRSLSDPAELFRFLNERLVRGGQKPFSQQRIRELTAPEAREARRAEHDAALEAQAALNEVGKRAADYKLPKELSVMTRIVPAFMENPEKEGAKERNEAFLKSLETEAGRHDLAMRAVELSEKTDEFVFMEQDPIKIMEKVKEQPELFTFGFTYMGLKTYTDTRPDIEPRVQAGIADRKTMWEMAGNLKGTIAEMADPMHELLGGLTQEETIAVMGVLSSSGRELLDKARNQVLSGYTATLLTSRERTKRAGLEGIGRALSEQGLLQGDYRYLDGNGRQMTHLEGIEAIAAGQQLTMEWYPSYTSGTGMSCTVSAQNGKLQMSEGVACHRSDILPQEYVPRWHEAAKHLKTIMDDGHGLTDADGNALTVNEALHRLQAHQEVLSIRQDQVLHIRNSGADGGKENIRLEEAAVPMKEEVERLLADTGRTLRFVQNFRAYNGLPPLSEERVRELSENAERSELHIQAKEALHRSSERRAYQDRYPCPPEAEHLKRLAQEFLEPDDTPEAAERNRAFMASLETPQGRRALFFRGLDVLEEGPGAFLETDIRKAIQDYLGQERRMTVGWAVQSTLINYVNSEEAADLDPELRQRLLERKSICEESSEVMDEITLAANDIYPALGGLNVEEAALMIGANRTRNPLETEVYAQISAQLSNLMSEKERWMTRQEPERKAVFTLGQQLQAEGLLKGDNVFRSEGGERVDHLDALQRIAAGEKLLLEHYDSRKAGEGLTYSVSFRDGRVLTDMGERCTREPMEERSYDLKLAALGKTVKETRDFASFRTRNGEALGWDVGLKQLAAGAEVILAAKDGKLERVRAEISDTEKGPRAELQRTPATQLELDTELTLEDDQLMLDLLSSAMEKRGMKPFSEERRAELLENSERLAQHAAALEAKAASDAQDRAVDSIQFPSELSTMRRIARLFLKAEDQPGAAEFNRAFAETLQTPEGRRELFYKVLDRIEREGEGTFLETDPDRMVELVREDATLGKMGFVMLAMQDYAGSDEGADLPEETVLRLRESKTLCEEGANLGTITEFRASSFYPLLGGLKFDELMQLQNVASASSRTELEEAISQKMTAFRTHAMSVNMEADQPRKELGIGAELGAMGLLKGDVIFRNENGERMKHLDALKAIADGQSVELEVYADRKADTGKVYTCSMEDGALSVRDGADCTRKAVPDQPFDVRTNAVGVALKKLAKDCQAVWRSADGTELTKREALKALMDGQTLSAVRYASENDYMGKIEPIRLAQDGKAPGGVTLNVGKASIVTRQVDLAQARTSAKAHIQELEKVQQVLKQSDPFYVKNSPQFKPMMDALDNVVRFHRNRQGFDNASRQQMAESYRRLNETVDAYLAVKTEKLRERTDDSRGQLRFDVVRSLKTMLDEGYLGRIGEQLSQQARREAARAPQAAAPQQKKNQSGPQL